MENFQARSAQHFSSKVRLKFFIHGPVHLETFFKCDHDRDEKFSIRD